MRLRLSDFGQNARCVHVACALAGRRPSQERGDITAAQPHHAQCDNLLMQNLTFAVCGEFITLDSLLKATGLAPSGGVAKLMVADGKVQVDGQLELRKTCKIRPGQVVALHGVRIRVEAESGVLNKPSTQPDA